MEKFKLQPILNYRQMLENIARQKLFEVFAEKGRLLKEIEEAGEKLETSYGTLEKRRSEGINIHELLMMETHIQYHLRLMKELNQKREQMEKKVEDKQMALKEAGRKKQLLGNLREKFIEKEKILLQQKEQAEIDEIAVLFYKR